MKKKIISKKIHESKFTDSKNIDETELAKCVNKNLPEGPFPTKLQQVNLEVSFKSPL